MQSSGLNFAKLLATEDNESDKEEPTQQHIPLRRRIISNMSNTVSLND
jgi:hypothetical protein